MSDASKSKWLVPTKTVREELGTTPVLAATPEAAVEGTLRAFAKESREVVFGKRQWREVDFERLPPAGMAKADSDGWYPPAQIEVEESSGAPTPLQPDRDRALEMIVGAWDYAMTQGIALMSQAADDAPHGMMELHGARVGWCAFKGPHPWLFFDKEQDAIDATAENGRPPVRCVLLKGRP